MKNTVSASLTSEGLTASIEVSMKVLKSRIHTSEYPSPALYPRVKRLWPMRSTFTSVESLRIDAASSLSLSAKDDDFFSEHEKNDRAIKKDRTAMNSDFLISI